MQAIEAITFASTLTRVLSGLIFLAAGATKLLEGTSAFFEYVLDYKVLPRVLARVVAVLLPWTEVALGFALMFGLITHVALPLAFFLTCIFTLVISLNIARGLKHQCACFGLILQEEIRWKHVFRNLVIGLILGVCFFFREVATRGIPAIDVVSGLLVAGWLLQVLVAAGLFLKVNIVPSLSTL